MPTNTPKFNLIKPLDSENYDVGVFNANADIIDSQIYSKLESDAKILEISSGKKIEIVAGVIRQDSVDKTKWYYINDGNHTPLGVSGDFATASGSNLTITFAKTYSKVVSFVCGPDETLANAHQLVLGASVGLSNVVIKGSASIVGSALIHFDGTNWVVANGSGQDIITGGPGLSFTTRLNIQHNYCPGSDIQLTQWNRAGAISDPLFPVIRSIAASNVLIDFVNYSGSLVTTPSNKMSFQFSKKYHEGILLDGSGGSSSLNLDSGNIWFIGLFEV